MPDDAIRRRPALDPQLFLVIVLAVIFTLALLADPGDRIVAWLVPARSSEVRR